MPAEKARERPRDRHGWTAAIAARRPPRRVDSDNRLVLLGTAGGSNPKSTRCGYSNAVVVGDTAYLIDCGEGVHSQMWRAGLALHYNHDPGRPLVRGVFVTHLHADHIMDLVNLLQGSWPSQRLDLYGPSAAGAPIAKHDDPVHPLRFPDDPTPGIRAVVDYLHRAFALNINARIVAERRSDYLDQLYIHEIGVLGDQPAPEIAFAVDVDRSMVQFTVPEMEPVVIRPTDERGVTVSAVLVQHAPVFPAIAYRFDTPTGSVVFSGDTGPCNNVVRLAQGADILVHEIIDLDLLLGRLTRLPNYAEVRSQLARSHSAPEDVGAIATRAGVKTLVLSHLVPCEESHSEAEWEALVRPYFDGEVVCGVDLDEFALG